MSTKRREHPRRLGRGPSGLWLCSCGCGREAIPPRKYWFSEACVHEWRIRNQQGYARLQVFLRDKGVCASCGLDTEKERIEEHTKFVKTQEWVHRGWRRDQNRWQADHIVPVAEGGGQTGLENLRTLCTACHLAESRKLSARLVERRRLERLKTVLDQPILPL